MIQRIEKTGTLIQHNRAGIIVKIVGTVVGSFDVLCKDGKHRKLDFNDIDKWNYYDRTNELEKELIAIEEKNFWSGNNETLERQ